MFFVAGQDSHNVLRTHRTYPAPGKPLRPENRDACGHSEITENPG
jgi:hypothetical protein